MNCSGWRALLLWAALLALAASGPAAWAQRTLNRGLHAVPAPAQVSIDGDLSEWDSSGAIICCKDVATMLDTESVRVSAMWDRDDLYVAFEFRDPTPMQNKIDPVTMPGNGWRSDAVQLRCNMAGFVSHIDAWYYTPGKRPAMTIQYGRFGVEGGGQPQVDRPEYPEQMGAQQAFRPAADGRGYTQEMKLPWAVIALDAKLLPAGADLRLGLEMFWGDVTAESWPRSRVTDNLSDTATTTDFFWTAVDNWGRLILEDHNNLKLPPPAWQLATKAEPPGLVPITFSIARDSFVTIAIEDQAGNRVNSLLGGLRFPKGTHTVYWSGLNDRNELLPAGRYLWRGLYRDQLDVRWRMSFYQPNQQIPWNNAEGTGGWGPDHGTLRAVAVGGGRVYLAGLGAEAGNGLFAVDEAGKKLWTAKYCEADRLAYADGTLYAYTGAGGSPWLGIAAQGVMQLDAASGQWLDIPGPDGKPTRRLSLVGEGEQVAGFAADWNALYVSVKGKSLIRSFHRKTFARQREYAVPGAGELFAPGDGSLLVASTQGLVELKLDTAQVNALVTGDFGAARAITADAKGRIYVAVGAPHHQAHVYERNGSRAREVAVLGKDGGRTQNGWYDPREGFYGPCGLAADSRDQLWVVEDSYKPKRVSVWQNGRWQRDFIGDTGYGGGGVINPLDPTMAFYNGMQFRVDLDKGTWQLKQIGMALPDKAQDYGLEANESEYMMAYKGRAYVLNCRSPRQIFRERKDGRWALCMHLDPQQKLAWVDRNDDCKIQDDEVARGQANEDWGGTDYWGMRPSQNLDLYFTRGVDRAGLRLRLQGVTPGGTPLYDFTKFEQMAGECMNGIGLRDGSYNSGCAGERGEYFSEMRRIYPAGTAQRTFWFRGENTGRWTYRLPAPGLVLYPFQAHGIADVPDFGGEVVCWVSDFGQRYLFTDDMLYVDQLFRDARSSYENWPDNPKPGFLANNMALGQESFHGYFSRLKDGRYILTSGFTDCRVFEVTGLDSLRRMSGETELKPEHLARAREIREFRLTGGQGPGTVIVQRMRQPVAVDGVLNEWTRENAVQIKVDEQRSAQVLTAYDQASLYVAWDVQDASPMRNGAQRWELAFKGGDAVDLMLRPPGEKLDDPAARAGDLRLLIAMLQGQARAVLYRPISAAKQPYTFDAFEGAGRPNALAMDEVRLADEVRAAIKPGQQGYVVEATIPWKLLGAEPRAGAEGRMDFGVLFSDPQGMRTDVRAYWQNRDTNIVTDIPSEARLQPGDWGISRLGE